MWVPRGHLAAFCSLTSPRSDLSIAIGGVIGAFFYVGYQYLVMNPYSAKVGWPVNEKRLEPALVSAIIAPIGLFIFGEPRLPNIQNRLRANLCPASF